MSSPEDSTPLVPRGTGKIASALAKAQGAFKKLSKSRTATVVHKAGGQHSYNYADLADVMDCCREALSQNELAISQTVFDNGLSTYLWHSSGEMLDNWVPLHATLGTGPQSFASSLTYARRYGLTSLLAIVAEDDDDAQGAELAGGANQRAAKTNLASQGPKKEAIKASQADWQDKLITEKQLTALHAMAPKAGFSKEQMREVIKNVFKKDSSKELTQVEASKLLDDLKRTIEGK